MLSPEQIFGQQIGTIRRNNLKQLDEVNENVNFFTVQLNENFPISQLFLKKEDMAELKIMKQSISTDLIFNRFLKFFNDKRRTIKSSIIVNENEIEKIKKENTPEKRNQNKNEVFHFLIRKGSKPKKLLPLTEVKRKIDDLELKNWFNKQFLEKQKNTEANYTKLIKRIRLYKILNLNQESENYDPRESWWRRTSRNIIENAGEGAKETGGNMIGTAINSLIGG